MGKKIDVQSKAGVVTDKATERKPLIDLSKGPVTIETTEEVLIPTTVPELWALLNARLTAIEEKLVSRLTTGKEVISILTSLHAEQGITLVMVTHDPGIAQHCQRIINLKDGQIDSEVKV